MNAKAEAVKVWQDPNDMVNNWATDTAKHELEARIGAMTSDELSVVDLGCGAGRLIDRIKYKTYEGYDGSLAMLGLAAEHKRPNVTLSMADIFNFQPDRHYNLVIMYDVAQHQETPIEALRRAATLWKADRYIMTLLVGDRHEDLALSTIAAFSELVEFMRSIHVLSMYVQPTNSESFATVLLEFTCK